MPAGSGVHVHFDEGEGEVQSRGGIKGALACGVHTRFERCAMRVGVGVLQERALNPHWDSTHSYPD